MFRPNDKIGPYTLMRELGHGSFGVVWLAERRTAIATTQFALKLPLGEEIDLEAVKQEAAVWVRASGHPNVLPIIEADVYNGQIVIVSEYAPDGSLTEWLRRHGGKAPSSEAAVEMMDGILAGLEHLHVRQIIHRDLKPANVLLQGEIPRLADFGISRVLKSTTHSTESYPLLFEPFSNSRPESPSLRAWGHTVTGQPQQKISLSGQLNFSVTLTNITPPFSTSYPTDS